MRKERIHNLDGLRFVAAMVVFAAHLGHFFKYWGYGDFGIQPELDFMGPLMVTFFFVLSGFLITYRLLEEIKQDPSGRINILRFYKKRILRIWPLYYVIVFMAFFIFRYIDPLTHPSFDSSFHAGKLIGYLLFLPNTVQQFMGRQAYLAPTWSLGVEEFFYLLFPLLFVWAQKRRTFLTYTLLIALTGLGAILFKVYSRGEQDWRIQVIGNYVDNYRFYSLLLGVITAYLYDSLKGRSFFPKNKWIGHGVGLAVALCLVFQIGDALYKHELYSLFFALMFLAFTLTRLNIVMVNLPLIKYLGKISFGIYLYQPMLIVLSYYLLKNLDVGNILFRVILSTLSLGLTLAVSHFSYKYMEEPLINSRRFLGKPI